MPFGDDIKKINKYIFVSIENQKTDDSFDKENGPIFFYAGNEGDIEAFWNNTGFMFDIAPMFQAMVVFAEHVSNIFGSLKS